MLLWLAACTDGGDSDTAAGDCFSHPAAAEVGASATLPDGTLGWVSVAEGDAATIIHGPQGGWHILASGRVTNMGDIVTIAYGITVGDGGSVVSNNSYRVQVLKDEVCSGYYPGMYGYLDVTGIAEGEADTPPELLAGETLTLTMTMTDLDGRSATDTLHVVGQLDPADA